MPQRCSCELTLALLEHLGGHHAARMRRAGSTRVGDWHARDWYAHMDEEEALMLPLLPPKVAGALLLDHGDIRRHFRAHGPSAPVPEELAVGHAELEDLWAEHLAQIHGWNLHDH